MNNPAESTSRIRLVNDQSFDDGLTLEEVLEERGVPVRDCRTCPKFVPDSLGRGFGWCQAYDKYVKLYHPVGQWHSQCQFQNIRLARKLRPRAADVPPR
jgi:hypothetical protein